MGKAIVILLAATPVCAALTACIVVLSAHVLLTGEPFTGGDVGMALVFGLGSLSVVVLGLSMTYRNRDRWTHKAIGALLAVGTVVGIGGGVVFALDIVADKEESMAARVLDACITARRGGREIPRCEERAVECIQRVRREPPAAGRGLQAPPTDRGRPTDPIRGAVDDCLRR